MRRAGLEALVTSRRALLSMHSAPPDKAESVAHVIAAVEDYAERLMAFAVLMKEASARLRIALRTRPDVQQLLDAAGIAAPSEHTLDPGIPGGPLNGPQF